MLYFKISIHSHHFKLSAVQPRGREVIEAFAKQYVQYGLVREGRRYIRAPIKVFGARLKNHSQYRFHINQYERFLEHLSNTGIPAHAYSIDTVPVPTPLSVELATLPQWSERPHQVPIIQYLIAPEPRKAKLVEIQTGQGKAQPLDAAIKVPGGWAFMGNMKVGTEVIAKDGSVTKVTGVFPQGEKEIFKVTFADGRSTECCAEHLWKVYYINTVPNRRWRIVNTMEMLRLISMPNPRVYVDLIDPEDKPDSNLPLDPYVLGLLLGDGHLGGAIKFSKADQEVIEKLESKLPQGVKLSHRSGVDYDIVRVDPGKPNPVAVVLDSLGLRYKLSATKFIPEEYLHSSREQRLNILQGLLDSDGTVDKNSGTVSFASVSEQLAKGVQYLVRSLGGIASISTKTPTYTYNGVKRRGQLAYNVNIRYKKPSELFTLKRKKDLTNDDNQYSADLKLRVMSVESVGFKQAQCISIEHPDRLYVTNDFIVTHNTFSALRGASFLGFRFCVIIRPMYIDKWVSDVKEILGLEGDDVIVVRGSGKLMEVIALAKAGQLQCKCLIISNKTLQNWYTLYEQLGDQILDQGYDCLPEDFMQTLQVGTRIIDEVHLDFHLNFKIDLYTHVERSISLSATLKADDPFLTRMYEVAYPRGMRYAGQPYNKYVSAFAWLYQVSDPKKIRTTEWGSTSYSHHAFEKSIMKIPNYLDDYLEMITAAVRDMHMRSYQKGDRCLVYCAGIQTCTIVKEHLKEAFPGMDVRRYVEDDPYEDVLQADISVSTLLSAGTGLDIPMLTSVVLTTAISSSQSNIQGFGRLREIKDRSLRFAYFVCTDIPKHLEYHLRKKMLLATMAKTYSPINYSVVIGH